MTHCGACGKHFSGVTAFDAHRTGEYTAFAYKKAGVMYPAKPYTRRCMTDEEMRQKGFECEIQTLKEGQRTLWYQVEKREALLRAYPRKLGTSEEETDPAESEVANG